MLDIVRDLPMVKIYDEIFDGRKGTLGLVDRPGEVEGMSEIRKNFLDLPEVKFYKSLRWAKDIPEDMATL